MKKTRSGYTSLASSALFGFLLSSTAASADIEKFIENCKSCHGKDGVSTVADIPSIASYSVTYMTDSMQKFKKEERPCTTTGHRTGSSYGWQTDMCDIAKGLNDNDIQQIAEYYAGKTFVRTPQIFDAALADKGKQIHNSKCNTCHDESGTLPSDDVGILGGQKMLYLTNTFKYFKEGKRKLPKGMKQKVEALDDAQIEALIHFYGSVQ